MWSLNFMAYFTSLHFTSLHSQHRMREETLKGIVPLLPLLNSANLNDKLVGKYLVTLQQCETESSIRTNCIILIGKIAHMLSDSIRWVMWHGLLFH